MSTTITKPTYEDLLGTLATLLGAIDGDCDPDAGDFRDQVVNYIDTQVRHVVRQATE